MTNKTKITVKERKPGTSRKLCKMPISTPEKAARSTAKLFSNADHVLNAKGIAMDISTNSVVGVSQLVFFCIRFLCRKGKH
jgi:hypothetical protein